MSNSNTPTDDSGPDSTVHNDLSPTTSYRWPDSTSFTGLAPHTVSSPQQQAYAAAIVKGRRLLGSIRTSSEIPSQFTSAAQLKDWGYITTIPTESSEWASALLQLLLPGRTHAATTLTSIHSTTTTHNGIVSPDTDAWFANTIDLTNGVIIAGANYGPVFTVQQDMILKQDEVLPTLMHWSDIAYLQTKSLSQLGVIEDYVPGDTVLSDTNAIKALKYIVRYEIENYTTNFVVHCIIQNHTGEACLYYIPDWTSSTGCPHCCAKIAWPGITFEMDTEEAMALLGTPNGCGVAWLLAQHGEFAGKHVARVRVWSDVGTKRTTPNLLFYIEDVDAEDEQVPENVMDEMGGKVDQDQ